MLNYNTVLRMIENCYILNSIDRDKLKNFQLFQTSDARCNFKIITNYPLVLKYKSVHYVYIDNKLIECS